MMPAKSKACFKVQDLGRALPTLGENYMFRILTIILCLIAMPLAAQDKYEGYYYPPISTTEVFDRVVRAPGVANKAVRVDFLTQLTKAQLAAPEAPQYAFFAKGEGSTQMIVVGLDDQTFKTLFRARGVMAQMTANVRSSPIFQGQNLQFLATFYDLLQILEFDSLVLSDGENWAHKVEFKR